MTVWIEIKTKYCVPTCLSWPVVSVSGVYSIRKASSIY